MSRKTDHTKHEHPAARASALTFVFAVVMLGNANVLLPRDFAPQAVPNNPVAGFVDGLNRQTSRFLSVPSRF